jgi:hypothetical protein
MLNAISQKVVDTAYAVTQTQCVWKAVVKSTPIIVALVAISNIPTVEAGSGAYWACIQTCRAAAPHSWITAIGCPIICAPFLAAPGG